MSLTDILDSASTRHAHRLALVSKRARLTYGDLRPALARLDVEIPYLARARVAVLLVDSLGCALLYLQLFERGATAIPLSVRATTSQLATTLARAQPHYVVTNTSLYNRHSAVLRDYDCLEIEAADSHTPKFTPRARAGADAERVFGGTRTSRPAEVRTILFTSGSTGVPKGVCLSEGNVLAAAAMMVDFLGLNPERRTVVTPPLYDYYGYIQSFAHAIVGAACIIGESGAFPANVIAAIETERATDLAVVPHSLRQLIDVVERQSGAFPESLRYITSSSDVLTRALLDRLFALGPHLVMYNIYGLTEAGRACSRRITADSPASSSVGIPSRGVDITIDGNRERPGEIVIRGPNVAGFLRGIRDDRIEVTPNDRIETGDLGYFDDSGEIVLVGRKDHMLNVMGEKLHPSEIESVALRLKGIEDAAARLEGESNGNVRVVLDVVCDDLEQRIGELKRMLRTNLPLAFVPGDIRSVQHIARTELGSKVKRGPSVS